MKIAVLSTLIILSTFGCNLNEMTKTSDLSDINLEVFEKWKIEYKNITFSRCLFLGFNRSDEIRNVMKLDNSTHQDFAFGLEQYRYIDSIVGPIIKLIKLDSVQNYHNKLQKINKIELNELNGKPVFKFCLEFYASEKLDKIAIERVNQMEFLWK